MARAGVEKNPVSAYKKKVPCNVALKKGKVRGTRRTRVEKKKGHQRGKELTRRTDGKIGKRC